MRRFFFRSVFENYFAAEAFVPRDFTLGEDLIGLTDGVRIDDLEFRGEKILLDGDMVARLNGVDTPDLTTADFAIL
ncbi:hypothetical protein [Acuticoccus mangrovi]|uniref:Uncharacterized protein n=1 Tax=Acuticoccus mangrovi TaxID=2796142 RepID=A0A934IPG3_9HYPH|nr:hypothetical protein [Acuticoccus mangrovi]MBJ3776256.1 hypothetical protein [Acuticoccus mangrovi]